MTKAPELGVATGVVGGMGDNEPAKWVEEAHKYFQANGHYRATDLQRVLGDPAASFEGRATSESCEQLIGSSAKD